MLDDCQRSKAVQLDLPEEKTWNVDEEIALLQQAIEILSQKIVAPPLSDITPVIATVK